jgi:uncharacterized protein (DUF924 family)
MAGENYGQACIDEILELWFSERAAKKWFRSTPEFDDELRQRFEGVVQAALAGKLVSWKETPRGALALVIVLDQFPLNIYRGKAESFAGEAGARRVAADAIERGFDGQLEEKQKVFLYMPFMHSENLADQDRAVALFEAAGMKDNLRWAKHHRGIVERFGRFPHRNASLGRDPTEEEVAWLNSKEAFLG